MLETTRSSSEELPSNANSMKGSIQVATDCWCIKSYEYDRHDSTSLEPLSPKMEALLLAHKSGAKFEIEKTWYLPNVSNEVLLAN